MSIESFTEQDIHEALNMAMEQRAWQEARQEARQNVTQADLDRAFQSALNTLLVRQFPESQEECIDRVIKAINTDSLARYNGPHIIDINGRYETIHLDAGQIIGQDVPRGADILARRFHVEQGETSQIRLNKAIENLYGKRSKLASSLIELAEKILEEKERTELENQPIELAEEILEENAKKATNPSRFNEIWLTLIHQIKRFFEIVS